MLITSVVLVGFAEIFIWLMFFLGTNGKIQQDTMCGEKVQDKIMKPGKSAT